MVGKYFNFDKENIPSMKQIMRDISVIFVNSHYSLGFNKPDLPNVVNVAGIHFTSPKPLPDVSFQSFISLKYKNPHFSTQLSHPHNELFQHLQKFIDKAEHGVIYVSFGSYLDFGPTHQLGPTIIELLKVLPQKIVVKWNQNLSPYGSENILIAEWFPQSDILSKKMMFFVNVLSTKIIMLLWG